MTVLTTAPEHAALIRQSDADGGRLVVVWLCAAWCMTCAEFRATAEALADARPDITFVWLDVENDWEVCGDVEVENFPSVVAWRGGAMLHWGIVAPKSAIVTRLVEDLSRPDRAAVAVPEEVRVLRTALLEHAKGQR